MRQDSPPVRLKGESFTAQVVAGMEKEEPSEQAKRGSIKCLWEAPRRKGGWWVTFLTTYHWGMWRRKLSCETSRRIAEDNIR